jgi:hypothetical protein
MRGGGYDIPGLAIGILQKASEPDKEPFIFNSTGGSGNNSPTFSIFDFYPANLKI